MSILQDLVESFDSNESTFEGSMPSTFLSKSKTILSSASRIAATALSLSGDIGKPKETDSAVMFTWTVNNLSSRDLVKIDKMLNRYLGKSSEKIFVVTDGGEVSFSDDRKHKNILEQTSNGQGTLEVVVRIGYWD